MKRYIKVYAALWKMSFNVLTVYRANFFNSMASSISWAMFSIISILLLTSRVGMIYGWTKTEIILLTCGYQIMIGVFHTLFSRNFERMADLIEWGQLDALLVKPLNVQFLLSVSWVNHTSISRIILGFGMLVYIITTTGIQTSVIEAVSFMVLLGVGVVLLYSVWFIVATFIIWFPRMSNVIELMYTISGIARYPGEMYRNALGSLFFVLLPVILIVTTPIKLLVSKGSLQEIVLLVGLATTCLLVSSRFWKFALRRYTSASS